MTKRVRVKSNFPPGHIRTPFYLRGKTGVIERKLGSFGNPETQAYRHIGDRKELLRVRFSMDEIWGAEAENPNDTLEAEIFEHWLEVVN